MNSEHALREHSRVSMKVQHMILLFARLNATHSDMLAGTTLLSQKYYAEAVPRTFNPLKDTIPWLAPMPLNTDLSIDDYDEIPVLHVNAVLCCASCATLSAMHSRHEYSRRS